MGSKYLGSNIATRSPFTWLSHGLKAPQRGTGIIGAREQLWPGHLQVPVREEAKGRAWTLVGGRPEVAVPASMLCLCGKKHFSHDCCEYHTIKEDIVKGGHSAEKVSRKLPTEEAQVLPQLLPLGDARGAEAGRLQFWLQGKQDPELAG